jgi:hypothetical protein
MGLKCHHTAGYLAMQCFIFKQSQHGLVTTMHAIKIANRQGAASERSVLS